MIDWAKILKKIPEAWTIPSRKSVQELIDDDEYKSKKIELLSQFPWRHVMETASVEEVNLTNIKAKILEIEKPRNDWSTAKDTAKGTTPLCPFD